MSFYKKLHFWNFQRPLDKVCIADSLTCWDPMLQSWGLWMLLLACNLFKITLILRKHSAANQYRYYLKEGLIRIEFLHLVLMSPRAAWTLSIFTGSVSTSWYKLMCIVVFPQIAGWPDYLHIIVLSLFPDLLFSLFTFPTWLAVTGHVGSDDSNLNKVQSYFCESLKTFQTSMLNPRPWMKDTPLMWNQ